MELDDSVPSLIETPIARVMYTHHKCVKHPQASTPLARRHRSMIPKHIEIVHEGLGYAEPANQSDRDLLSSLEEQRDHLSTLPQAPHSVAELSMLRWLIANGRFFNPASRDREYPLGEPNACFLNAQTQVLNSDTLTYVEGFATTIVPHHHAWIADASGNLVEPTWQPDTSKNPIDIAYFGVPLTKNSVKHSVLESGFYKELLTLSAFAEVDGVSE